MTNEQIEQLIHAFRQLSKGVNKIGDGVQSIAFYVWLPIYIALFLLIVLGICAFVYFG